MDSEDSTLQTSSLPKNNKKQEPLKEHLNQDDTKWQKDWLLSVVAVGTLLGTVPITWITEKLGIRLINKIFLMLKNLNYILLPEYIMIYMNILQENRSRNVLINNKPSRQLIA